MNQIYNNHTTLYRKNKNKISIFTNWKILIISAGLCSLLLTACYVSGKPIVKIKIDNKVYKFEVAVTEEQRHQGLMHRKHLDKNSGMLFVYGQKQQLSFYMKNTFIPLDIAFIDEQFKIIDIQSMEPLDTKSIKSKGRAMYALEVNQGFFERVGLAVDDTINFTTPIPYE